MTRPLQVLRTILFFGHSSRLYLRLVDKDQTAIEVAGDMSLVGPRPHALGSRAGEKLFWEIDPNYWQRHALKPGITGLAQVNNIDMSTPKLLAETDARMLAEMTVTNYFKYIFLTLFGKGFGDRIQNS